ncbi:MAG: DNA topoisomerase I subunit omega [Deltaproteobacteria bacterium]|nr:DNA topoisomerase I subunit omega [Deltaproteobacteria bacterium]
MGKSLVIVESPAKARTINKYLGRDFVVKSSVGHVRDLPVSGSGRQVDAKARAKAAAKTRALAKTLTPKQRAARKKKKTREAMIARMGINPDQDWKAHYEVLPGKEKVVKELRKLAKDADTVYLATDLDREGEAIAWHLREIIGGSEDRFKRVVFNEITKTAIQEAFEDPGQLDISRVNAQQARRFLDRVVGYMLSPLLWSKVARGLSAGRVQSVAVRLLVEREREIHAFVPEEFWEIYADLKTAGDDPLRFQVLKENGSEFRPGTQADAEAAVVRLEGGVFEVKDRKDKPTTSRPSAPYITSTLQQAASTRLSFSVKKTMMLAQRLYEAGHITYMRTDSTNLSQEAVEACRGHIHSQYGEAYLPDQPKLYSSKEGAQEAHEAIRPSDVSVEPDQMVDLERDQARLYEMIWRQFVACQMPPARYKSTNILLEVEGFELRTRGRILVFDGYTKVQPPAGRSDSGPLPDVQVGEILNLVKIDPIQHFTKPPPRFSEASLVKELESRGIGRPSTYASIISTIQDRGYARVENRRFYAEKIGDIVTERLVESFEDLMDFGFTAQLEESLDEIALGKKNWKRVLGDFYKDFNKKIENAGGDEGMRSNQPTNADIDCPDCGRQMQIRTASTGVFLGCSGYGLPPKERCKTTINLTAGDEAVSADAEDQEESEARLLLKRFRCPKCKTSMDNYLIDETRKLHVCGNNPDCDGHRVEQGHFVIKGYDGPILDCDKCSAEMQLRTGRFGKYFACTSDDCKNTRKLLRSGEPAPPKADPIPMPELKCEKCEDHYLLRDGAAGIFLAASQFPKNRETRAPTVEEVVSVAEQLDPKLAYIAKAPALDGAGRKAVVRFLRKTREQYVMTEVDGKASGWRAFYRDGEWVEEHPKPAAPKKAAKKRKKARAKKTASKKAVAKKAAGPKSASKKKGVKKKKASKKKAAS